MRVARSSLTAVEIPELPVAVMGTMPMAAVLSWLTCSGPAILPCSVVRRVETVASSNVPLSAV